MSNWAQIATTALSVLGGGGGLGAAVSAIIRHRNTKAEAADVITDTALTLVEPLKIRVRELENDLNRLRGEATATADELQRVRTAIMEPTATVEGLRALISRSGRNGVIY